MYSIKKVVGVIVPLLILSVYFISCDDDDCPTCSSFGISITCPSDTVVPINLSSPEEIGVYPTVSSKCMSDPTVTSIDSVPEGMTGGFIRIWEVTDSCGNSARCLQSIGLGAPEPVAHH